MAIYYVSSVDGSDSDNGTTWALAKATLKAGVDLATTNGDQVFVDSAHNEETTTAITYTVAADIQVLSVNRSTGVQESGAQVIGATNNLNLLFYGGKTVFWYGIKLQSYGTGDLQIYAGDGNHYHFESCTFSHQTNSGSIIIFGNSYGNQYFEFFNCNFVTGNSAQILSLNDGIIYFKNCIFSGTNPTRYFTSQTTTRMKPILFECCDLSWCTGTLFADSIGSASYIVLSNCKLGSGVTVMEAAASILNKGNNNIWLYNCSAADQHYHLAHYDAFGSTIIDTGIYANDGASYDGTNYCSWKIVTTANCNYWHPYVSPWIECYHSGTSAITPSIEILRSGSATAYQNDEVWGEFSYQGTSGFPLGIMVNDRMALLGTPADQTTGALGAGDWTGENATSWFGKLSPTTTITPAEIGHLRARVCVGGPEITVYVDPTIRGRS